MTDQVKEMSESEKKKEDWMNSKWRPMMGWMYMAVCTSDFIIFPVLWSIVQVVGGGEVKTQWSPITLQGAGLFHMAMGAILGIAAYGRTQEKLGGANNGGIAAPSSSPAAFSPAPAMPAAAPSFSAPIAAAPTPVAVPAAVPAVTLSSTGKTMPPPAPEPEL